MITSSKKPSAPLQTGLFIRPAFCIAPGASSVSLRSAGLCQCRGLTLTAVRCPPTARRSSRSGPCCPQCSVQGSDGVGLADVLSLPTLTKVVAAHSPPAAGVCKLIRGRAHFIHHRSPAITCFSPWHRSFHEQPLDKHWLSLAYPGTCQAHVLLSGRRAQSSPTARPPTHTLRGAVPPGGQGEARQTSRRHPRCA